MRYIFLMIFLSCTGLIGYAVYLQLFENLLPCPLCVAQRIVYWIIGITALVAYLNQASSSLLKIYRGLIVLFSITGAVIAARHAWLIRFPESFECGISPEEAFLNALPLAQWWPMMFEANGDCADTSWKFILLTIPDWSLIAFIFIGVATLLSGLKSK
ncbi:MAG: disulfide bond formation protein B [Nitrosomonas sp.]|nr:disulfide bond formation protein B [Nitrosomonas sp.]MBK7364662.1 disulfide bond formation protein B [Nitrosomonas sp.]